MTYDFLRLRFLAVRDDSQPEELMVVCEECGSSNVSAAWIEGVSVRECGLCGTLVGDDDSVAHVLLVREARDKGYHPAVYPLVVQLNKIPGLTVVGSEPGDPAICTWPYVQIALGRHAGQALATTALENLTKSLALGNAGPVRPGAHCSRVHWVLELEYQSRLLATLKPRFLGGLPEIGCAELEAARRDLARVSRNLQRDRFLSWWRD